jgi:hypothetical protein
MGFRSLILWQKAHALVLEIYKITSSLPKSEQFGIRNQIQRSCTSVPANIAEGYGRVSKKEKIQENLTEVSKILNSYIKKMKESI